MFNLLTGINSKEINQQQPAAALAHTGLPFSKHRPA